MTDAPGPWVAPDAPAEPQPVPGPATSPAAGGPGGPGGPGLDGAPVGTARRPPPPPGLPVPLRPLSAGDVLDGAVRILKLAPRTVLLLAAAFVVPVQLVTAVALPDVVGVDRTGFGGVLGGTSSSSVSFSADILAFGLLLQGVSITLVCAGITHLVNAWYAGEDRTTADVFRAVGRRAAPALLAWLLVHVVEAVFLLGLVVAALVPMAWFLVATPVVAEEGLGAWRALGRSRRLTSRRFGAVLGIGLLVALVDLALTIGLGALAGVYAAFGLPFEWLMATVLSIATLFVTVPFVAGAAALVHLDLRVRTEGYDIELAMARRFAGGGS